MVAIFTGLGSGFEQGSGASLGPFGILGGGTLGRGGEGVSVNAATGNLLLTHQDEFLIGQGPDIGISRTYNSLGDADHDDNGDLWRQSTDRRVLNHTGTYNTTNATIDRLSADGSVITYTYQTVDGDAAYWTTDGAGAHDKLEYDSGTGDWTWTDGTTQIEEVYEAHGTDNWRITEQSDTDGNALTFTYTGDDLTKVETQDGGYVEYTWSGGHITKVVTGYTDLETSTTHTHTSTHYHYSTAVNDSSREILTKMIVDMSPGDALIADGDTYETTYTYDDDGVLTRIAQTDGSRLDIEYDGSNRITKLKNVVYHPTSTVSSIRETNFDYQSTFTEVVDPNGHKTRLYYDSKNQLTKIQASADSNDPTSSPLTSEFTYDTDGNVLRVTNADGTFRAYSYDERGNVSRSVDENGVMTLRTYDDHNNLIRQSQLLRDIISLDTDDLTSSASGDPQNLNAPDNAWSFDEGVAEIYLDGSLPGLASRDVITAEVGRTYQMSIEVRIEGATWAPNGNPGGTPVNLSMNRMDSNYAQIGISNSAVGSEVLDNGWVRIDFEYTTQTGDEYLRPYFYARTSIAGNGTVEVRNFTVDDGGLEQEFLHTRYVYDSEDHLAYTISAEGNVRRFTYTAAGDLEYTYGFPDHTYSAGTGVPTKSEMDTWRSNLATQNELSSVHISKMVYDDRSNLKQAVYWSGATDSGGADSSEGYRDIRYVHDHRGQLISRYTVDSNFTGGNVEKEEFAYDAMGRMTSATNLNNGTTTIQFTDNLRTTLTTTAYGLAVTETYNSAGELMSRLESAATIENGTDTYAYDKNGRLRVMTDGVDNKHYYVYDKLGRKTADVNELGDMTEYKYDDNGLVIGTARYFNAVSAANLTTLSSSTNTLEVSDIRPNTGSADIWQWTGYDDEGRIIRSIDGDGSVTEFTYDKADRLVSSHGFYNKLTSTQITSLSVGTTSAEEVSLPTADTNNDVIVRTFYDDDGRVIGTLNGIGHLSQNVYDNMGQLIEGIVYDDATDTQYRTDGTFDDLLGSLTVSASKDIHIHNVYDGQGFLRFAIDGLGHVIESVYKSDTNNNTSHGITRQTIAHASPLGTVTDYKYETIKTAVAALTDPDNETQKQWSVYNATHQLAYTVDAEGGVAGYSYNSSGDVETVTVYSVKFDTSTITDVPSLSDMNDHHNDYASTARLTKQYYDGRGQINFRIDAERYITEFTYDEDGRLELENQYNTQVAQTILDNNDTALEFQQLNLGTSAEIEYEYDEAGRLMDVEAPDDTHTRITYYNNGNKKTEVRAFGLSDASTTKYEYDQSGNITKEHHGYGTSAVTVTNYVYDGIGNLQSQTRAHGNTRDASVSRIEYDQSGQKVKEYQAYGTSEQTEISYAYDGLGNLTTVTDENGNDTIFTYDKVGRVLIRTDAESGVTSYEYDTFGNVVKTTDARGNDSFSYYDELNRLVLSVDAEKYAVRTAYTDFGEVESVIRYDTQITGTVAVGTEPTVVTDSALDAVTEFEYDDLGRMTKTTDAEDHSETYVLDAFGQRTSVTNKLDGVTTYTYDDRGRLISETLASTASSFDTNDTETTAAIINKYTYDARGNLTQKVEADGLTEERTTTYTYDANNRLIKTERDAIDVYLNATDGTVTSLTPTEHLVYDLRGNVIEREVDLESGSLRMLYYYDALDRVTHQISSGGTLTRHFYDDNGNVTETRVYETLVTLPTDLTLAPPNGTGDFRETHFEYDDLNRLTKSWVPGIQTASYDGTFSVATGNLETLYEYDASGNVIKVTDANDNKTFSYYDKVGNKTWQVDADNYLTKWEYDADGNVTLERRYAQAVTVDSVFAEITTNFNSVDYTNNWPSHKHRGNPIEDILDEPYRDRVTEFTYDENGRRLSETRRNVIIYNTSGDAGDFTTSDSTVSYLYNGLGEVTQKTYATGDTVTYIYDNGGRLTEEKKQSFINRHNNTVTPTTNYFYDGLGNLVRNVQDDGTTGTVNDRVTTYTYEHGRLDTTTNAADFTKTYHYDAAGRVVRERYDRTTAGTTTSTEAVAYEYDDDGRVTKQGVISHDGSAWAWGDGSDTDYVNTTYNAFGQVATRGMNGSYNEQFSYDDAGRVWKTNTGDGAWKYFMYDKNGNQVLSVVSTGYIDSTETNNITDFTSISQVLDRWHATNRSKVATDYNDELAATITEYDARNMAKEVLEPQRELDASTTENLTTKRTYNAFGEVLTETDARGYAITYQYNEMGRTIKIESPQVSVTDETGTTTTTNPTEKMYYDKSGRLVASRDANDNLTTRALLAGTGYEGGQALVSTVTNVTNVASQGSGPQVETRFDIFGDAREVEDQLGRVTEQTYDKMGRVTDIIRPDTDTVTTGQQGLTDSYAYDELGQRIQHYNNQTGFGSTNAETTTYDAQGRVLEQIAFGGEYTSHDYEWVASLDTDGLGTYGGWEQTTTRAFDSTTTTGARETVTKTTVFGHQTYAEDMGGNETAFNFDAAGRLSTAATTISATTTTLTYTYLNTGRVDQITGDGKTTTYGYDKAGNLTSEHFKVGADVYKNATATYDALGRLTQWSDTGTAGTETPSATVNYKYDANGNIRNKAITNQYLDFDGDIGTGSQTRDYWYRYDHMNRVVLSQGHLDTTNNVIENGAWGTEIFYDDAGQRAYTLSNFRDYYYHLGEGESGPPSGEDTIYGPPPTNLTPDEDEGYWEAFTNIRREDYDYDAAGRLENVYINEGSFNPFYKPASSDPLINTQVIAPAGQGTLRASYEYDQMGRMTKQKDYHIKAKNGDKTAFERVTTYNARSQMTSEQTYTVRWDENYTSGDTHKTVTTNTYGTGSTYAFGQVVSSTSDTYTNNGNSTSGSPDSETSTTNTYIWRGGPLLSTIIYDEDTTDSGSTDRVTTNTYSTLSALTNADIADGRARDADYITDHSGQVIRRDETDGKTSGTNYGDPHEVWHRFGGKQMGYVGNNGTTNTDYEASIADRTTTPDSNHTTQGAFRHGEHQSDPYSDFDQSYDRINSYNQGATAGTYTVRGGETLAGIAQTIYGDSGLWYKLAEANGLSASANLSAGTTLRLPTGVIRNTNNASTVRPHNPGETIGDISPTTPEPPKETTQCAEFGRIIISTVAVVAAIYLAGPFAKALTPFLGKAATVAGASAAAATTSTVSQGVMVATGIQEKFSWQEVGMSAIGAGVGAGIGQLAGGAGILGKVLSNDFISGAVGSAATQGIGVATGLQDKFSWASVAAAGVGAMVGGHVKKNYSGKFGVTVADMFKSEDLGEIATSGFTVTASAVANAATRSAIDGSNFGDNFRAAIPDVIGQAIVGTVAGDAKFEMGIVRLERMPPFKGLTRPQLEQAYTFAGRYSDGDAGGLIKGMQSNEGLRNAFSNGLDVLLNPMNYEGRINTARSYALELGVEVAGFYEGDAARATARSQITTAYKRLEMWTTAVEAGASMDAQGNITQNDSNPYAVSEAVQARLGQSNTFTKVVGGASGLLNGVANTHEYIAKNIERKPLLKYGFIGLDIATGPVAYGVRTGANAIFGEQINAGLGYVSGQTAGMLLEVGLDPERVMGAATGAGSLLSLSLFGRKGIDKIGEIKGGLNLYKFGHPTSLQGSGWKDGDYFLYLPNQGTSKANWKQNSGRMRNVMQEGNPIYDSFIDPKTGFQLEAKKGTFLYAERHLLETRGWTYDIDTRSYRPPTE